MSTYDRVQYPNVYKLLFMVRSRLTSYYSYMDNSKKLVGLEKECS